MDFIGAQDTSVLQALLTAATLLSVGLLIALVAVERDADHRRSRTVILEPAPTPEPLPVVTRRPLGRPPVHLSRAPPVSPQRLQFGFTDHPSVE